MRRRKSVVLSLGVLQDHIVLYREPVNPLIEFGMSADGPHMYHIEKLGMHTVEQVQSETGLVHQGWNRTKSHRGKGKRSSLVRRLICLRKSKDFKVSVRVGFSSGSTAVSS